MKRLLTIIVRCVGSLVVFALGILALSNLAPVFDFSGGQPFSGEHIYNPYSAFDSTLGWSRANFHCHTRVDGIFNECEFSPEETIEFYKKYGYDIATVSNHMEITPVWEDEQISIPVTVYEHGYNLFNNHHLVFSPEKVCYFEYLTPFTASQKQFLMDRLAKSGDFIFFNHIHRSRVFNPSQMKKLSGYVAVEADSSFEDEGQDLEFWDIALSAGHYSANITSDDLHFPDNSARLARRSSFLNVASTSYEDIRQAVIAGNLYSMKTPDFGNGDLGQKQRQNMQLPYIENIALVNDTIILDLSAPADSVVAIGQGGKKTLMEAGDGYVFKYLFKPEDTYIRLHADFGDSFEIYTNPFVRTADGQRPAITQPHSVNILLTVLYNLAVLAVSALLFSALVPIWRKRVKA
ncbi:MAG: hypothetical protein J6Z27_01475 [Bacteroidales bacterium]|nr:hypothetical protein [Bacteroidales bacterium]